MSQKTLNDNSDIVRGIPPLVEDGTPFLSAAPLPRSEEDPEEWFRTVALADSPHTESGLPARAEYLAVPLSATLKQCPLALSIGWNTDDLRDAFARHTKMLLTYSTKATLPQRLLTYMENNKSYNMSRLGELDETKWTAFVNDQKMPDPNDGHTARQTFILLGTRRQNESDTGKAIAGELWIDSRLNRFGSSTFSLFMSSLQEAECPNLSTIFMEVSTGRGRKDYLCVQEMADGCDVSIYRGKSLIFSRIEGPA